MNKITSNTSHAKLGTKNELADFLDIMHEII